MTVPPDVRDEAKRALHGEVRRISARLVALYSHARDLDDAELSAAIAEAVVFLNRGAK